VSGLHTVGAHDTPLRNGPLMRPLRPELLVVENIRALLYTRRVRAKDLARFCGHEPAWLTKILKGERGVSIDDLPRVAEFFGLETYQLLQHGISDERRRHQRRGRPDRRVLADRRHGWHEKGALHPSVEPRFREPRANDRRPRKAG
jgi:transcriptional regulator with XRE-family HTH domain